ncbi:galactose-binding domain-containing protein [Tellurirhabdus bombi]|uniref:galactose-binding domain-containing protein n=1 Tax=Tellurirhabdus bombi TaxID=2907205 RepID=UPI001F2202EE|nr:discoidin domain-containing protein [Tellurirhabdus bombi]
MRLIHPNKSLRWIAAAGLLATQWPVAHAQTVNIAKGKAISGFPVVADNPFENIVDGNDATVWYTNPAAPVNYFEVKLGKAYAVDRVLLRGFRGKDTIRISVEKNGSWQEVYNGNQPDKALISFTPVTTEKVRVEYRAKQKTELPEFEVYAHDPQPVFVNQIGYNLFAPKRFTAPLTPDGAAFHVVDAAGKSLFDGTVKGHIGDFTTFKPTQSGPYTVVVDGPQKGTSYPFEVAPYVIERASYRPAMAFMIDDRCWYGNSDAYAPTDKSADCPSLGVAWRDSHQFSFELQSLLALYSANPEAFSVERMPVEGIYTGVRDKLPENTPEIVRLIHWAVDVYLRGQVNHTLLKEQLAYFLYAYPDLSPYIPQKVYAEARDYLFKIWGNENKDRWHWYDLDHSANLFQTYTLVGTGKGQFPPGHSIVPNLMMYEVARRERRNDADAFFKAAFQQTDWLIKNLDWTDPGTTKGQRMNEHVTMEALAYFLKNYPDKAPKGLREKIQAWAKVVISRSDNMWDYRKYVDNKWVIADIKATSDPTYNSKGSFNEPGNIAGFPAPALAAVSVLNDEATKERLRQLATAQMDNVYGRNPTGRHYSYDALTDFEGADLGWFKELEGGAASLQTVRGVLDGSPKEGVYPYDPYSGDPGHTEGWVTFNTAWMAGLAYLAADVTEIQFYDAEFKNRIQQARSGQKIGIRLTAPLNLDPTKSEKAMVVLTDSKGAQNRMTLDEAGTNGVYFQQVIDLAASPVAVSKKGGLRASYGLGDFKKEAVLTIK